MGPARQLQLQRQFGSKSASTRPHFDGVLCGNLRVDLNQLHTQHIIPFGRGRLRQRKGHEVPITWTRRSLIPEVDSFVARKPAS